MRPVEDLRGHEVNLVLFGPRHERNWDRQRGGLTGRLVVIGRQPGKAEVHDAHLSVGAHHHVLRLEIPVHQFLVVGRAQPAARVGEHLQYLPQCTGLCQQPIPESVARYELHRDEDTSLEGSHVVDHDHIRMGHFRDGLGFADQLRPALIRVIACRIAWTVPDPQQFDSDLAIQLRIVSRVHVTHRAAAKEPEYDEPRDFRAPRQRFVDPRAEIAVGYRRHCRRPLQSVLYRRWLSPNEGAQARRPCCSAISRRREDIRRLGRASGAPRVGSKVLAIK